MEKQKKYKIVASDLDGTLLGKNQQISTENLAAIKKMCSLGVEFVPTTGRALSEIPQQLIELDEVRYIITSDGAAVWDKSQGKMILTHYISKENVKFIFDTVDSNNSFSLIHQDGDNYYEVKKYNSAFLDKCRVGQGFRNVINACALEINDLDDFLTRSNEIEMICLFFASDEELSECKRIFAGSDRLCVAQSDASNLEIYSSAAGKGNTLAAFAASLGVELSEVIAVGDSDNDITLLQTAGLGLAMENASDELKAIANKVICNNSEHCARYILENYVLQ